MARRAITRGIPIRYFQPIAESLRVIAHPVRLKIIELLMSNELTVGDLARVVGEKPAIVSQHLTHMRAHGILDRRRRGREVYYYVANEHAVGVLQCIQRKHQSDMSFQDGEAI